MKRSLFMLPTLKRTEMANKVISELLPFGDFLVGIYESDEKYLKDPRVKYVFLDKIGIGYARDKLLRLAVHMKYDFLVPIDDDISIKEGSFGKLEKILDKRKDISVLGPLIYDRSWIWKKVVDSKEDPVKHQVVYAFWMFRRDLPSKIGFFDTRLYHAEDQDFCIRARLIGDVCITKKLVIDHKRNREGGCSETFGGLKNRIGLEDDIRKENFDKYFYPKYNMILRQNKRGYKVFNEKRLKWYRNKLEAITINERGGIIE